MLNQNEIHYSRPLCKKAVKKSLKFNLNTRIGDRAVFEAMNSIDDFMDILAVGALKNLETENKLRREQGLEERKTLQAIDIKRASHLILLKDGGEG